MNKYVTRRVIRALKTDGQPYIQRGAERLREVHLRQGMVTPRRGEKIVGEISAYQSGVHMRPGTWSQLADQIKDMENRLATEQYGACCTKGYIENLLDRLRADARRSCLAK